MDTKERNRPSGQRRRSAPTRGRTAVSNREARKKTSETRRKSAALTRRRNTAPQRVVRPPKEDVPEVVYTMPKPIRRGRFLLQLASVVAVVAAVMMCLSLFFRVETVIVSGANKYTPWMVRQASGINEGDSLLGISDARISGRIINELPYVDEVKVGINLPGTVHIEITELQVTYAIQATDSSWWLISADGRVVEQVSASAASGYTRVLGVQVESPRKDTTVRAAQESGAADSVGDTEASEETTAGGVTVPQIPGVTGQTRLQAALSILKALEESGVIGTVGSVDVTDVERLTLDYAQRITVVLGDATRMDYKIDYMARAVEQIPDYEPGELDVSFEYSEEALFDPAD